MPNRGAATAWVEQLAVRISPHLALLLDRDRPRRVSTFLRHEAIFAYDLKSHDFFKTLHGPDAPGTPHPALRNAIFLVGCHFCGEPVASILEPVFLKRTRESLHHSLANVDRLVDFIEASTLLSGYQYLKGRCAI